MKMTVFQNMKQKFYALGEWMREYRRLGRECRKLRNVYSIKMQAVTTHVGDITPANVAMAQPRTCACIFCTMGRDITDDSKMEPRFTVLYCEHFDDGTACAQTDCPCHARNQECARAWQQYAAVRDMRRACLRGAGAHTK